MGKLTSLLKLSSIVKKYKYYLIISIFFTIITSIATIPIPYLIGKLTNEVFLGTKNINKFYFYISLIAILYFLNYIISFISKYITAKFNNLMVKDLRFLLIDKIMKLPMSYLNSIEKGYLQGRISECTSITTAFSSTITSTLLNITTIISSILAMFAINYKLGFVVLCLIPLFFIVVKISNTKLTINTQKTLEANANLNAANFEILNALEDIKILNGYKDSLTTFNKKLNSFIEVTLKQSKILIFLTSNMTGVNDLGNLLILFIAGILIIKGQFTVGMYTAFTLYSVKIFASTKTLAHIGPSLKRASLSTERIYEILEIKEENSNKVNTIKEKIKFIQVKNLSFKYKKNKKNTLENLNLEIKNGDKILISGENGSGKSTFIKLLLGLYEPLEGKIFYNKFDLATINRNSLREKIGVVSQNIFLFKGSVLENILYGSCNKDRQDVEKLIKDLELCSYINKLPNGLDTKIIQNNSGVSGGQAQVIAFIRALLTQKDILILDEPISNIDIETRGLLLKFLKNADYDGIVFVISHFTEELDFITKKITLRNN